MAGSTVQHSAERLVGLKVSCLAARWDILRAAWMELPMADSKEPNLAEWKVHLMVDSKAV